MQMKSSMSLASDDGLHRQTLACVAVAPLVLLSCSCPDHDQSSTQKRVQVSPATLENIEHVSYAKHATVTKQWCVGTARET